MSHYHNRVRFHALLLSFLLLAFAGTSAAQLTGTISGTVTDSEGVPLPGAAVTVDGTRLGATTDLDGNYFILQVPPGAQSVTARLIGFTPTTVADVRVSAGLTSRINFRLIEEAIEVDAITVTAERPPIQRDVTGSRAIVDASRVAEVPVSRTLDVLNFQPGVSVVRDNELEIRHGGPSQIRFQVDGLDRTDGLTGRGYTQLNQVLVSEVTLLTGGFNAEYGNVRSGMVNVVVKDGSERGGLLPWVAGVVNYAPAQKKHFGPGAYDEDQFHYHALTQSDSAKSGGQVLWPDLYEQTRSDSAFMSLVATNPAIYRIFEGWNRRQVTLNSRRVGRNSFFGYTDWTPEQIVEAWQYEANMNEVAWRYGHKPDWGVDLAAGWALPAKMGGIVLGYSHNRVMTSLPAARPEYYDRSFEGKLTLTPTDQLKIQLFFAKSDNKQPGTAEVSSEDVVTGAITEHGEPIPSRTAEALTFSVLGSTDLPSHNKLSLSQLGLLDGAFDQMGLTVTYTFSANTFATASIGRTKSTWDLYKHPPRADMLDPSSWPQDARYSPPDSWDFPAFLAQQYGYRGGYRIPPSLDFATNPDSVIFNSPYTNTHFYKEIPTETVFITRTFPFGPTVVSPQGHSFTGYSDLSGLWTLGDAFYFGHNLDASSEQITLRGDLTHATGRHAIKTGVEFIGRDLEYTYDKWRNWRDYGGDYPAAQPKYLGVYVQDKYESDGMIANFGVRTERFDAGHPSFYFDDLFNPVVFGGTTSLDIFRELTIAAGWDTNRVVSISATGDTTFLGLPGDPRGLYWSINDSLMKWHGVSAPLPHDVVHAWDKKDNKVHWRLSPRIGVSHPVSYRAKVFFNYGIFYQMQKPVHMYGYASHNSRPGAKGRIEDMYNPNLRPARTTMYEAGVENLLPYQAILRVVAFAKFNTDQVSRVEVRSEYFERYWTPRNLNYEDVFGYEFTISRSAGRFVNGAITYERQSSRTGEIGYKVIGDTPGKFQTTALPFVRARRPGAFLRAQVRFGTPSDWGTVGGGWALSAVQEWRKGGEVLYNPDNRPVRELSEDYYLPVADYINTDLRLSKSLMLPGRHRTVTLYMDVSNVFNQKRLNVNGVRNYTTDYQQEIYQRRLAGDDVKVGDKSTFKWLTEPFKRAHSGTWSKPISAETEWLHHLNPRFYRFGVRFEL